jgi:hypothetical protein
MALTQMAIVKVFLNQTTCLTGPSIPQVANILATPEIV